MATIYVDPTASTNGDGSFATPRNIYPTSLVYGDIVLFKEQTVYNGGWTLPTPSGTGSATNIVLLGTYDAITGLRTTDKTKQATIKATSSTTDAILTSGLSYITVSSLYCIGGYAFPASGVRMLNGSYLTVEYCTIESLPIPATSGGGYGIRIDNATGSGSAQSNWIVRYNNVSKIAGNGGILCIWSSTTGESVTNITVDNNLVFSLAEVAGATANGIVVQSRASVHYSDKAGLCAKGVVVTNNTVIGTPSFGIYLKGITWVTGAQKNLVSGNVIKNTGRGTIDMHCLWFGACFFFVVSNNKIDTSTALRNGSAGTGIGIFIDYPGVDTLDGCEDILVTRNIVSFTGKGSTANTEVGGAGIFVLHSRRVTVSYNLVQYCLNGIVIWGGNTVGDRSQNVKVYNNTVANNTGSGIYVCKIADLVDVKNNLSVNNAEGIYTETSGAGAITNYTETYNLVWNCYLKWTEGNAPTTTAATITTRIPAGTNLETDPKITTTYTISNTGTAYRAGTLVNPKLSLTGFSSYPTPSIGAYEYVAERGTR